MLLCGCYCCCCCCFSRPADALLCCAVSASALGTDLLRRVLNLKNTFSTSSVLPSTSVWEVYSETAIHYYNIHLAHVSVGGLFRNSHPSLQHTSRSRQCGRFIQKQLSIITIYLSLTSVWEVYSETAIHHYNIPLTHVSVGGLFKGIIHHYNIPLAHVSVGGLFKGIIHHYNIPLAHVSVGGLFKGIIHHYNIPPAHVSVGGLFKGIIHHYNLPRHHPSLQHTSRSRQCGSFIQKHHPSLQYTSPSRVTVS